MQAPAFAAGLPLGVGSGLTFAGVQADGSWLFYSLTDRGPNADAPDWRQGEAKLSGKIFVAPGFTPQILPIRVKDGQVSVGQPILLHDDKGPLHGLPLPVGVITSYSIHYTKLYELLASSGKRFSSPWALRVRSSRSW